jgi:hypothetical protein
VKESTFKREAMIQSARIRGVLALEKLVRRMKEEATKRLKDELRRKK